MLLEIVKFILSNSEKNYFKLCKGYFVSNLFMNSNLDWLPYEATFFWISDLSWNTTMQGATAFNFENDNNCWRQNDEDKNDNDDNFIKETVEINKHVIIGVDRPRMC